jgi:hypothetical protein
MLKVGEFRRVVTSRSDKGSFEGLGFLAPGAIFYITAINGDNASYTYDNKNGMSATKPITFIEECTVSMYSETAARKFDEDLEDLLGEK